MVTREFGAAWTPQSFPCMVIVISVSVLVRAVAAPHPHDSQIVIKARPPRPTLSGVESGEAVVEWTIHGLLPDLVYNVSHTLSDRTRGGEAGTPLALVSGWRYAEQKDTAGFQYALPSRPRGDYELSITVRESSFAGPHAPPLLAGEQIQFEKTVYIEGVDFFGCCLTPTGGMPLDLTLHRLIHETNGFFVEAGAYDGTTQSNTLLFETARNWTGLLVESSATLVERVRATRGTNCIVEHAALVGPELAGQLLPDPGGEPTGAVDSKGAGIKNVPAVTLSELLDKHVVSHVDFLSLDVEGHELAQAMSGPDIAYAGALQGLDLTRHRPTFILVEIWDMDSRIFEHLWEWEYNLVDLDMDPEGSINGWKHRSLHRDFLFTSLANFRTP